MFFAPVRAVPRPLHRTPKRRQRQTVVLQIHQLPIGKAPGFRPCVLLLPGIPGLRRHRGRHDGLLVPLFRAALIAEPFPPGGQKLPAPGAVRPWIFVSDVRSFTLSGIKWRAAQESNLLPPAVLRERILMRQLPIWEGCSSPVRPQLPVLVRTTRPAARGTRTPLCRRAGV